MLCGVTATLGSNPSATATAARPHRGRAVLLCLRGVREWFVAPLVLLVAARVFRAPEVPAAREARRPHVVRRRASKPARALRSLRRLPHQWRRVADRRLGVVSRSPAMPSGPSGAFHTGGAGSLMCALRVDPLSGQALPPPMGIAAAPSGALHTGGAGSLMCALRVDSLSDRAPPPPTNFARNSPAACSNIEFASLELQCFWGVSKKDHDKLRATFGQRGLCCRLWVLGSDSPAIPALVIPEAVGVLHYTKPAGGVSSACRTLM